MKLAATVQDFWKNPIGRCAAGNRFLFFCVKPNLWGYTLWGDVDAAVVRDMVDMVASELDHDVPLHGSFIDLRGVTLVDPSAYPALVDFIGKHGARLSALIEKMAIVRPKGIVGAIAEGISTQITFPHPLSIVESTDAALRFLGVEDAALAEELDGLRARVDVAPLLRSVRAFIEAHGCRVRLPQAAKALGLSPRTLQRNLSELGTSFQYEVNSAQITQAQKLLLETDAKLSTIAIEVGCPSLQHFSTLFRRMTGETPSVWRKERRRD
jgi:AraC-like DNA-binding protein